MVLLATLEEWQKQSSLLLQARPSTARITTKYNVPNLGAPKYNKPPSKTRSQQADSQASDAKPDERTPRATLTLKTHDTASGVVLKFKTDRAADVGRLIAGLGALGRHMAALPEKEEKDVVMTNTDDTAVAAANNKTAAQPQQTQTQAQTSNSNTGNKKKKKGKR